MNNHQPKFDGAKWRCADCQSVLATVAQVEKFSLPTMEAKMVAALELPTGFIKTSGDVWLRPKNYLPLGRGAANQKKRINIKQFREKQLGTAIEERDYASIVQSQMDLRQIAANAAAASSESEKAKPVRLRAEELPASIKCPKPGCDHISRLTSIRARHNTAELNDVCSVC